MDRGGRYKAHKRIIAGYDVRPVAHVRRVQRAEPVLQKPDISSYRAKGPGHNVSTVAAPHPKLGVQQQVSAGLSTHAPQQPPVAVRARAKRNRRSKPRMQMAFSSLAVLLLLCGVMVSIDGFRKNKAVEAQITRQTAASANAESDEVLDDTEPTSQAVKNHTVPADAPRYIVIDKIKVKARVKALDTKANGELAVPKNIFDVGWYQSGNKPGQDGAMLMDGHVSSPRKAGVFKKLPQLSAGDSIKVERGDGKIFQYRVVKTKAFPADKVDMQSTVVPVTPGKRGLNLITCHGKVRAGTNDFSERFIVYAEEI